MTPPKNPTNSDIWKKLDVMAADIDVLKTWKISQEAAKTAVDEYRRQEASSHVNQSRDTMFQSVKDITPYAIAVLVALASVLYVHAGAK